MNLYKYAKTIAAVIAGLFGLLAMQVPALAAIATPEMVAGATVLLTAAAVYAVPNLAEATNVADYVELFERLVADVEGEDAPAAPPIVPPVAEGGRLESAVLMKPRG